MPETAATRLLPILLEGIEISKMVLFRKLKAFSGQRQPEQAAAYHPQLAGAVLNDLFANPDELPEAAAAFMGANRQLIAQEQQAFASEHPEMRIILTDTLRMQTICDLMAGRPDPGILHRAEKTGILLSEREMPLPHTFIDMARRLGKAHGLLTPPVSREQ